MMALISRVVGTVVACVTAVLNYLTDAFLTAPLKAPKEYLEEAHLTTLSAGESTRVLLYRVLTFNCLNKCV